MNLEQLRGFAEIAEIGHFTRAAERLHLAQPSLSRQIASLESEFGIELFHRVRGGVRLTTAGEQLLPYARRMLADAEAARDEMASLAGLKRGRIRIGATPTLCTSLVVEVLAEFRERYPDIDIEILERGSRSLITALVEGGLDLALIVTSVSSGAARAVLELEPVLTERLVAVSASDRPDPFAPVAPVAKATPAAPVEPGDQVSPAGSNGRTHTPHPSRHGTAVTLEQLASVPVVQFPESYDLRAALDAAFRAEGLQQRVAVEGAEMDAALRFAERGVGVAVVPAMVAADRPELRSAPLESTALTRTISVARRADMAPSPANAAMQALIRDIADRLASQSGSLGRHVTRVPAALTG